MSGRTYLSLYGFQGLGELLGGMDNNSPQVSREGADDRFTKATLYTGRIQSLGHGALLVVRANGQATTGPLVVIEQMLLGGPDSVRGYQLGERFVDEGYTVSAETRVPFFPSVLGATQAGSLHRPWRWTVAQSPARRTALQQLDRHWCRLADRVALFFNQVAIRCRVSHRPHADRGNHCRRPLSDLLFTSHCTVLSNMRVTLPGHRYTMMSTVIRYNSLEQQYFLACIRDSPSEAYRLYNDFSLGMGDHLQRRSPLEQ